MSTYSWGLAAVLAFACVGCAQTMNGTWETPPPLTFGAVKAIVEFQGEVYVGGSFFGAQGNYVTRWNGTTYAPLAQQLPQQVTSMAVLDDGTGPALYAGGSSWNLGPLPSQTAMGVVKWNGQSWSGTGFPINPGSTGVTDLVVFDDGQGGGAAVYAATPNTSQGLWRRSGSTWIQMIGAPAGQSLAVFDEGAGPALYSGGTFSLAGGVPVKSIAKLRQGAWSDVGGGLTYSTGSLGNVSCLRVLDLGQGPRLFVGGGFTRAGTLPVHFITSWDGAAWTAYRFSGYQQFLLQGQNLITSFAVLRETHPPLLLAGATQLSSYPSAGIQGGVLAWDGERWFDAGSPGTSQVFALLPRPGTASVLVGGSMPGSIPLAKWTPNPQCYANCDWSTVAPILNLNDFLCFMDKFAAGDVWANCDTSSASPALNVNDFMCFMNRFAAGCD